MFFLISYGLLNYATYFESRTKSPSFRPRFRFFHERLSLIGCVACVAAIVAIHPTAGAIAFALLIATHQFLGYTTGRVRWADSSRSYSFQRIRQHLVSMSEGEEHPRDWRPVILAFSDDPVRRERLMRFGSWIEGGSGLTTAIRMLAGEGIQGRREGEAAEAELARDVRERGLDAFARVIVASDVAAAFPVVLQAAGLGPIRANTVLLNWFDQERLTLESPGLVSFGTHLRAAIRQGCNVILLAATMAEMKALEATRTNKRRVDVWWSDDTSSRLALMLAYLMTRTPDWDDARIRLVGAVPPDAAVDELRAELEGLLEEVRIDAATEILPGADRAALIAASADASLVFVPSRLRDEEFLDSGGEPFGDSLEELPAVALVLAAGEIELDSQPDEGRKAELADALQHAEEAEKRAKSLGDEAQQAAEEHEQILAELAAAAAKGLSSEEIEELRKAATEAEARAEQTRRRAAKADVKARDATSEADTLVSGPEP